MAEGLHYEQIRAETRHRDRCLSFTRRAPRFILRAGKAGIDLLSILCSGSRAPVLLFASLTAWTYVRAEQERALERAQALAHELSDAVDRELAGPRLVMEALATSEELRRGDLQAFHPSAAAVPDSLGLTIVVRAPGQPRQLLNTSVPWGTPLPRPNPAIAEFDQRVLQQKKGPIVTNIIHRPSAEASACHGDCAGPARRRRDLSARRRHTG